MSHLLEVSDELYAALQAAANARGTNSAWMDRRTPAARPRDCRHAR